MLLSIVIVAPMLHYCMHWATSPDLRETNRQVRGFVGCRPLVYFFCSYLLLVDWFIVVYRASKRDGKVGVILLVVMSIHPSDTICKSTSRWARFHYLLLLFSLIGALWARDRRDSIHVHWSIGIPWSPFLVVGRLCILVWIHNDVMREWRS